jgi:hypothetical protein
MRRALIRIVTLAAGLVVGMQAAGAQGGSFFQERYCSQGMGSFRFGGELDCSYRTWQHVHRKRTRIRSLLPPESMVARAARTAVDARQEPAAQSSVMSLTLAALFGATELPSRRSRCSCQRRLHRAVRPVREPPRCVRGRSEASWGQRAASGRLACVSH